MHPRSISMYVLVALCGAASSAAAQATHPAVTELRAYQRAAVDRDGDAAAGRVTAATVRFYDRCRRAALTMPEAELRRQPAIMRLTTLSLRIDHTAAQLRRMDGRAVLASMIDNGQVVGLDDALVGDVRPGAQATQIDVRRESGARMGTVTMRLERGAWRLDLLELMRLVNAMVDRADRRRVGATDAPLMLALALMHRGRRLPDTADLWVPLEHR